jgi:threonine dehydratase
MITYADAVRARQIISPYIYKTQLLRMGYLSKLTDRDIYLKLENMQKSGSFKIRGACNKVANLTPDEKSRGVIAPSAGNHAQGVAASAKAFGINATIVMPKTTPISKIKATRDYGARVVLAGDIYDEAYLKAKEIEKEENLVFVHPFDDELVMAGQGTIALEIFEDLQDVDIIVVPVGGGGLISGISVIAKTLNPKVKVIGVQTENAASMKASFEAGKIIQCLITPSIAEGITVKIPGQKTFEVIRKYVDDIITVSDDEIASSILLLLEKQKIVAEGSGAAPVAAVLSPQFRKYEGQKVVCLISGGNIDMNVIESIINRGLINDGRRFEISIKLKHKAGELQKLCKVIADAGGNIYTIDQNRYKKDLGVGEQEVNIIIEAFDNDHKEAILQTLQIQGYKNLKE